MLPVLGVEVTFRTASHLAAAAIEREYGAWRSLLHPSGLVRRSPTAVTVVVRNSTATWSGPPTFRYGLPGPGRMAAACAGGYGSAEVARSQATITVDQRLLESPRDFTRGLVEPLLLMLLGGQDRVPLHAGGVIRGDVGIVLAGPSGVGKSTVAYAAAREGYLPLADDPVYIQDEPALRVWGRRGELRLRSSAREFFPELIEVEPTDEPGGKTKLVVDLGTGRPYIDRVGLCVLRRGSLDHPTLTRISPERASVELAARLDPGFALFRDVIGERILRVAERGAWILELGSDPRDAVELLDRAAEVVEA